MQLDEMKIIVTGAGGGMGAHFALRLLQAGARVAAIDVNADGLKALAEASAGIRGKLLTRQVDVADDAQRATFVDWAFDGMGGLNGLVNNAGILRDGLLVKKDRTTGQVVAMDREQWQKVIDVNLTAASLMVRDAIAKMVRGEQAPGVVVNMSSVARYGNRGQSNYVAAKAALAANTVTWAREFAPFRVRVGAIAPGMIETPMTQGMNQKARDALVAAIPVGRIGVPEDIWLAVKFIIECDFFNGRTIDVDGGMSI
jgi:3-oxoacyl-[acyl-carrier protein] reductase